MTETSSRLVLLSLSINENTAKLDRFLHENQLSQTPFDSDSPQAFNVPLEVESARTAIINKTLKLHQLCMNPNIHVDAF